MYTKVFLITFAVFVFLVGTIEAKNSSHKQADAFAWESSPLLPTSTVGILGQQRWLGVSDVHGSYLGASLNPAGSSNPNDAEAYSTSGNAYFFVGKDRKDSGEAFEGARRGCGLPKSKFLVGSLAGFVGGIGGAILGFAVYPCSGDDCLGSGSLLGLIVLGFTGGSIIGSSSGVYLVGRLSGETGSYWATLLGSALGTSGVVLATIATLSVAGEPTAGNVFLLSALTLPAAGATIGFNLTKGKEQKDSAAINLEEGNISFAFPSLQMQVSRIPNHRPEIDYTLRLVSARF